MTQPDHARRTGPALEAMYRFLLWLIPTLEKFPRGQRFLLGDRIENAALDTLDLLIQATYSRDRQALLHRANLGLERLRVLSRLAHDLGYLDHRCYEHAARAASLSTSTSGEWSAQRTLRTAA